MYASARDWARFGLFYLNDGVAGSERLLPEGWVAKSTKPVEAAPLGQYGYQIWLNAGARNDPAKREYPDAPTDMYYADGHEGQYVYVIPSKQLVVVRLGLTEGKFDGDTFLKELLQAIPQ
jgi:CubicO group peptidase (beta-lactamase class C family)